MRTICSILMFVVSLIALTCNAMAVNVGEPYKFVYVVQDSNRGFVSGLEPYLSIQRSSDSTWFDFNDAAFKSSGWTEKTHVMGEDVEGGFYYFKFTPPSSETGAEVYQFVLDLDSVVYPDHQVAPIVYEDNARNRFVNGLKDNGDYEGIEKMIRIHQ